MNFDERVAIISGATGGLGKETTRRFAEAGSNLVLLGRNTDKLDSLVQEMGLGTERVLTQSVDLSNFQSVEAVKAATLKKFGRIDILINLIGGWIGGKSVIETDYADIGEMLNQHVHANFALIKSFVPEMIENKWGRVLAVSSPYASRPVAKLSPYAIGKAGLEALLLTLAKEIKGSGVTANMLLVNTIDTKHERESNPSKKNKNWSTPEEISANLLHLCSEEAGMINGARIPLYGSP
jgi:NAD(P)-dependent dehydrogenase (short-subunit alcohol dehydrogenase family)